MKRRQNHWYLVEEAKAEEMRAAGFKTKQTPTGAWMVLCHPSALMKFSNSPNKKAPLK